MPVPARHARGEDVRPPRGAAAVGDRAGPRGAAGARRGDRHARWPRTRGERYASAGELARAALAAVDRPSLARGVSGSRRASARPAGAGRDAAAAPARRRAAGALVGETGAFVGRDDALERLREPLRRRRRAASASSCCSPASPGSARRGWRPSSRARRTPSGAIVLYGRSRPRVARPLPAVRHRASSTTSRTRDARRCPPSSSPSWRELARFVPALRRHLPGAARPDRRGRPRRAATGSSRRSRALLAYVAARARRSVLVLDDLQWADTSTALLLAHLLGDAEPARLLVLGTIRDADGHRSEELDRPARAAAPRPGVRADRAARARRRRDRRRSSRAHGARERQRVVRAAPAREHRRQPVLHQGDAAQPRRGRRPRACPRASRS